MKRGIGLKFAINLGVFVAATSEIWTRLRTPPALCRSNV